MATKASIKVSYTINSGPTYIAKVNRKAPIEIDDGAGHFASTCLKPCLQAILLSRPELLENAADYSICCLDQQETDAVRTRRDEAKRLGNPFSPVKVTGDKVWEGKGMLSWVMQENDASITDPEADGSTACGKLSGSTLHVTLSFTQRNTISRNSFLDQLRAPSPVNSTFTATSPQTNVPDPFLAPPSSLPSSSAPEASRASAISSPLAPQPAFSVNVIQPTPIAPSTASSKSHAPLSPSAAPASAPLAIGAAVPSTSKSIDPTPTANAAAATLDAARPTSSRPSLKRKGKTPEGHTPDYTDGPVQATSPSTVANSAADVGSASAGQKARKLKYSQEGCINCGVKYALIWRKRKNGAGGGKLCNSCGVYFNKHGVHRKISEQTKGTNANGVADTSCEDIAPRPTKQRKIDQSDISADLPNLDASLRRSPRRPATVSKSGLSHTVAASSPGPRANHAFSLPQLPRSPHRNHRKQDAPTSSSLFNSIPHSTFDSDFTALNTDIFSTLTSDAPMPDTTEGMDPALSFDAIFSDIDMGKLFSDAPTNAAPEHGCPKAPAATHLLPDLFASQQLHSDAITEVDLPPSSPPRDRARDKLFPEALNATASEGGSPNVGDTPADTSNPTSSHLPNAIAQKAAESGITWSEDAVNALTNALLAQAAKAGQVDLSEQTLRDLFENFVSGASPEKRWSGDDSQHPGSTPIVSPSPQEDRGAENSKFNIEPVAEVNAEVALEIWKNEVRDRFNKAI